LSSDVSILTDSIVDWLYYRSPIYVYTTTTATGDFRVAFALCLR